MTKLHTQERKASMNGQEPTPASLLVVIAVIGLLSAILTPALWESLGNSQAHGHADKHR